MKNFSVLAQIVVEAYFCNTQIKLYNHESKH